LCPLLSPFTDVAALCERHPIRDASSTDTDSVVHAYHAGYSMKRVESGAPHGLMTYTALLQPRQGCSRLALVCLAERVDPASSLASSQRRRRGGSLMCASGGESTCPPSFQKRDASSTDTDSVVHGSSLDRGARDWLSCVSPKGSILPPLLLHRSADVMKQAWRIAHVRKRRRIHVPTIVPEAGCVFDGY
jgi:hypothetical protein